MVQEILRLDYQSVPNNESIRSINDPMQNAVTNGHKRINSASLDFFLSNTEHIASANKESIKEEKEKKEEEKESEDAEEIRLFSRNKKKR